MLRSTQYVRKNDGIQFDDTLYECLLECVQTVRTSGSVTGIAVRDYFTKYFTSLQGSVPWQCGKMLHLFLASTDISFMEAQNTFSYVIKIVPPFPFQSLFTGVTVSRVRKQWEPGGLFFLF